MKIDMYNYQKKQFFQQEISYIGLKNKFLILA